MSTPRPGSLRARPIAAATLAGGLVIALTLAGALDGLERIEYDLLFRIRGARPPVAPIVIAAIDEASLKALGSWPVPRAIHARAIDRLREAGAAVMAVDLLFPEPSLPDPLAVADVALFSTLRWWPRSGLVILALALASLAAIVADATGRPRTAGEG